MINKRGVSWKPFIIVGIILIALVALGALIGTDAFVNWSRDFKISTDIIGFDKIFGSAFSFMNYIFGGIPAWLNERVGQTSAVVITIAMFFLLFITFGDIIAAFSTFSAPVSWISAFLIAVIAANLKGIIVLLGFVVGIFAFVGGLAVVIGLIASFIAFIAVNWGIGQLGPFVMRRRAMMIADKNATEIVAGAKSIKGTIEGLGDIGEGLKALGKKK